MIYRGTRVADERPVILKWYRQAYPSAQESARFRREYELTRKLSHEGIAEALSLEQSQEHHVLVLADTGGRSLNAFADRYGDWRWAVEIVLQVVEALGVVHGAHMIHKDINPSNIVWNAQTGRAQMIDFGLAVSLSREQPALCHPHVLEGTLAYISPEQTGRMNRRIDYRSDFYSLGVTLFELCCKRKPFEADDAMGWVHCHIAKEPPDPREAQPALPASLAAVIAKLLAKRAEDRYQSTFGLLHDLRRCLEDPKQDFVPGQRDISARLEIPQILYGRDAEIAALFEAYQQISEGERALIFVAGDAGIGKTALIQELYKPSTSRRGYFIAGKYEQFKQNSPYMALLQAFGGLLEQLLSGPEEELSRWREQLTDALGNNGQVLIDVLPSLALLIGPQPPCPPLPPDAAQNRFQFTFLQLLRCFATTDHPLVIFLDDLQWADTASVRFMELVLLEARISHLMLLGAYRDQALSDAHPLQVLLGGSHAPSLLFQSFRLGPISPEHVGHMLAEALHTAPDDVKQLAAFCHDKTGGNPFFLRQFLHMLHDEGLLRFDQEQGRWEWDLDDLQHRPLMSHVVELLMRKLQGLAPATQEALHLAACIGNVFSLQLLALVMKSKVSVVYERLWDALRQGLLHPLDDAYKWLEGSHAPPRVLLRFAHDRIQQAAYELPLQGEGQASRRHYEIGQLMLAHMDDDDREEQLFEIVEQLNRGSAHIASPDERAQLCQYNQAAAHKARHATAWSAAYAYFSQALSLLPDDVWRAAPALALELHAETAEAAYLCADYERFEQIVAEVMEHVSAPLDKARLHELRVQAYTAQDQNIKAVQEAVAALRGLDVNLPAEPTNLDILLGLLRVKWSIRTYTPAALLELPEMTDPTALMATRILSRSSAAAYTVQPKLFPVALLHMLRLFLRHGHSEHSPGLFAGYGLLIAEIFGDIDGAYRFGELAVRCAAQRATKAERSKVTLLWSFCLATRKEHLRDHIAPMEKAHRDCLECGDFLYAARIAQGVGVLALFSGEPLDQVFQKMQQYSRLMEEIGQEDILQWQLPYQAAVAFFLDTGATQAPPSSERRDASPSASDAAQPYHLQLKAPQDPDAQTAWAVYYLSLTMVAVHVGDAAEAGALAPLLEGRRDAVFGTLVVPLLSYYVGLASALALSGTTGRQRRRHHKRAKQAQKRLARAARHAPMNYLHKWHLVEAMRLVGLGGKDAHKAAHHFHEAITHARSHGYTQDEALAFQLAGAHFRSCEQHKLAGMYLLDARQAYARWGAQAMVARLDAQLADYLPALHLSASQQRLFSAYGPHESVASTTSSSLSQELDLSTVMKAAQAISGAIVLRQLLGQFLEIIVENAGAQRGCLVLKQQDRWLVEAEAAVERDALVLSQVLQSIPVTESPSLCPAVFSYVKRTKEAIVLTDASAEGAFVAEPYIVAHRPKSILCSPIMHQGKPIGVVYLENNLATGAFTSDRLEVLQLLCAQAAISIENARLYASLEDKVAARTQELQEAFAQLEAKHQELKTAQSQLVQSEKMASLGTLVSGVAHEINNPTNFTFGGAQNLQRRLDQLRDWLLELLGDNAEPHVVEAFEDKLSPLFSNLESILDGATRIKTIVKDLRTFSRLDEAEHKHTPIVENIQSTLSLVRSQYKEKVDFITDFRDDPALNCWPAQLNQVFMNVIVNACQAILTRQSQEPDAPHGQLIVTTQIDETPSLGRVLRITFKDNGCGLDAAKAERIFEPFYTTKPIGEGTGLGLSISYGILEKHNGQLDFASTPGQGSIMTLTLPAPLSPEEAAHDKRQEPTS